MGRPKIKNIESDFDLEKIVLPEEKATLPKLDEKSEDLLKQKIKKQLSTDKQSRKESKDSTKKTNIKVKKPSKRFDVLRKQIEKDKTYSLSEAIELIKKTSNTKFDSSIEVHINLRIDPSKQEQQIRTTTLLPHGNGKKIKVLVFGAKESKAIKESGGEVGNEETLGKIEKGKIDFDKIVASPEWMLKLAKVAKVLGPKGLMPNPKSGTVSADPEKVAKELSGGLIEIKTENSPIIHTVIGKASFKNSALEENITSLVEAVKAAKPTEFKKELIASVFLASSMGPSVKIDTSSGA